MNRTLLAGLLLGTLCSCVAPSDRIPLKMLPEDGQPILYSDLLERARTQADMANKAFYIDRWDDLEDAARGLEQTARFMGTASSVPAPLEKSLAELSGDLGKEAVKLKEAARSRNVEEANSVMQRVNLKIRQLRSDK